MPRAWGIPAPSGTVAKTVLVFASSTDTDVGLVPFTTYTRLPFGCTATALGPAPTGTAVTTVLDRASTTVTVFSSSFVTYTRVPSG